MDKINSILNKGLNIFKSEDKISSRRKIYNSIWAIFIGILISSIIILSLSESPIFVFTQFIKTSFLPSNIKSFWGYFSLFSITGIAVGIGFKVGLFNIGVPGQMMLAGMFSMLFLLSNGATTSNIIISLVISIILGSLLALLPGILKAFLNVHEVVTTILLNWIVAYLGVWLYTTNKPQYADEQKRFSLRVTLPEGFRLENFWPFLLAFTILLTIVLWVVLQKTKLGYKIKMTGINQNASKYSGVNEKTTTILTMLFSGALAGIAGWIYYVIIKQTYQAAPVPLEKGFTGIAISLLAYNSPIGILFSSIFFVLLEVGATDVVFLSDVLENDHLEIISGIIIYLSALSVVFMKFNIMHLSRKYIFLTFNKEYRQKRKEHYLKVKNSFIKFHKDKKDIKALQSKFKKHYKEINNKIKNLIDFKKIKNMSNKDKIDYYDQAMIDKKNLTQQLENIHYLDLKNLKAKYKSSKAEESRQYKIFKNSLFEACKNTDKEFLYIPILKIKKLFVKKKVQGGK